MNLNALHQLGSFKRLFFICQLKENYKNFTPTYWQTTKHVRYLPMKTKSQRSRLGQDFKLRLYHMTNPI